MEDGVVADGDVGPDDEGEPRVGVQQAVQQAGSW
jgi:hypothetical protein